MWKVVAADDEAYIREALKKLINWEKMDCNLINVVDNGQELINKIEEQEYNREYVQKNSLPYKN